MSRTRHRLRLLIRNLFHRGDVEADLSDELQTYLEMSADEKARSGIPEAEAMRQARLELGGTAPVAERVRDVRNGAVVDTLIRDVRFSLRMLGRNPGFAATAVIALALGIGANTAIFSLAEATLFRAPAVRDPEQLVSVWTTCRLGTPRCASSYPDYLDYRDRVSALEGLAATSFMAASLGDDTGAELVGTLLVTGNYFEVVGITPAAGRLLQPDDDRPGDPVPVVVISHDLWQTRYAGASDIVGRDVPINRARFTIVGVAPPGFEGVGLGDGPGIWVPMFSGPILGTGAVSDNSRFAERDSRWIDQLVGRRSPGRNLTQLRTELDLLSDRLAAEYPEERGPRKLPSTPPQRSCFQWAAKPRSFVSSVC